MYPVDSPPRSALVQCVTAIRTETESVRYYRYGNRSAQSDVRDVTLVESDLVREALLCVSAVCGSSWPLVPDSRRAQRTPSKSLSPLVGYAAPDFELTDTAGSRVTLSSLKGKTVVLRIFGRHGVPPVEKSFPVISFPRLAQELLRQRSGCPWH